MGDLLPLFPLPNVVLFPNVFLPLHIFEPRYRDMVADALAGDRMLGMVLLRPGWEQNYEGRPPIYEIGCSGVISHCEKLPDGRYNLILRGIERFRVVSEEATRVYRRAMVEPYPDANPASDDRQILSTLRSKLERFLAPLLHRHSESLTATSLDDGEFVNALAQYLHFEALEKQALLECRSARLRAEALNELLEMKALMAKTSGLSGLSH